MPLYVLFLATIILGTVYYLIARTGYRLTYNVTPSVPVGLYLVSASGKVKVGDIVLLHPPADYLQQLGPRSWLRKELPLLKRIVAESGDIVCFKETTLQVNGKDLVPIYSADREGKELSHLAGCQVLESESVLPVGTADALSFDGRYFGPIPTSSLLGLATPLLTKGK